MTSVPRVGLSSGSTVNSPWPSDSHLTPSLGLAGRARDDGDLVGDHERGVEADAELADQLRAGPCASACLQAFEERPRAGRAMVPRFSTIVSRDMPMPLSETVSVPASSSGMSLIFQSLVAFEQLGVASSESKRTLLMASLALLISSRRKISLFE